MPRCLFDTKIFDARFLISGKKQQDWIKIIPAHPDIRNLVPLAARIGMDKVKTELQNLSFAELEPKANSPIRARLNDLRAQETDGFHLLFFPLIHLNDLRGQGVDAIEDIR
ncbi:hypothetical protein JGUZn3_09160 [Entomobacter blattae]|uniref:Uncharacterized protein n=1 Tax=Entomobacter blattae TaxID=2762277 RepID=A0A7H1NQT8_9PROT|nr:hypothetical protein JGUZn3_09160 [Entomobacter blattae]